MQMSNKEILDVMSGLPTFARTMPIDDVVLNLSCALGDAAARKDVSEADRAYLVAARRILQMIEGRQSLIAPAIDAMVDEARPEPKLDDPTTSPHYAI